MKCMLFSATRGILLESKRFLYYDSLVFLKGITDHKDCPPWSICLYICVTAHQFYTIGVGHEKIHEHESTNGNIVSKVTSSASGCLTRHVREAVQIKS